MNGSYRLAKISSEQATISYGIAIISYEQAMVSYDLAMIYLWLESLKGKIEMR